VLSLQLIAFQAVLDCVRPGAVILAEACQRPRDVVEYFGNGDECQIAYHFPLMPMIFQSLMLENNTAIVRILRDETPPIPDECQWFSFLRVHDEVTLEMCDEDVRDAVYRHYVHDPKFDFRNGIGVSQRLFNLLRRNVDAVAMAMSIIFTVLGTPIIFYGDEFAKENDEAFYQETLAHSHIPDTRYYCRGRVDWSQVESDLADPNTNAHRLNSAIREMRESLFCFLFFVENCSACSTATSRLLRSWCTRIRSCPRSFW
jgi:maltose alpha-D-glucosyltransferase/alpha-amylase